MTLEKTFYVLLLLACTVMPIVFRSNWILRVLCVLLLLLTSLSIIHFGLRLAARNVTLPPQEVFSQKVPYAVAWQAGRMSTQEKVDFQRPVLVFLFVSLSILAVIPLKK